MAGDGPSAPREIPVALDVRSIRKSFGSHEVLKGISLAAREHDVVAILGSSGSGKSTFLRCINLLETPDGGEVRLKGELIRMRQRGGMLVPADMKQVDRIRSRLSMVFQQFNLWQHMTILENVTAAQIHVLGRDRKSAVEKAEAMLAKVGVADKRGHYPGQLSGGQQQRVAIARALAMDPEVMLFDEPTSALDPELVNEVLKVMRDLAAEGRTMLIVTHEMGFAREAASHMLFLHQGLVEDEGPPREIMANPNSERFRQFLSGSLK
ncbi:ABC transporter ATP-binding protein [Amaricoccus solimangrovi]|uniref:ATP-binding cassette domain-containing protein n=1 Tax=Amaricoccus solimangrovi TaxID=2589815 RepID=A0A501WQR8_9RHOB|nr:ATP-binding cassette domain-containing protein [Amaricoccus solimangrovi]TPE50710.1 ATP-binding cassette domain-containing protein [Amaricoccus solimangrovi]